MNNNVLKGNLVYKGETGLSAYQIAVQNGFQGSEQDWLASLGTSSKFEKDTTTTETSSEQSIFLIPTSATQQAYIEVYVDGKKMPDSAITLDWDTKTVILSEPVEAGKIVEVLSTTMMTTELPITDTLNEQSTNRTAAGTKSVYDYGQEIKQAAIGYFDGHKTNVIDENSTDYTYPTTKAVYEALKKDKLVNMIYPVGSIYISVNDIDPSLAFGGRWEKIKDRFLLGAGGTYNLGATGGESAHKLTISEMPTHNHSMNSAGAHTHQLGRNQDKVQKGDSYDKPNDASQTSDRGYQSTSAGAHTHTINNAGGNAAHNNMPPYLAVNVWKRVE